MFVLQLSCFPSSISFIFYLVLRLETQVSKGSCLWVIISSLGHAVALCKLCVLINKSLAGSSGGAFVLDNMLSSPCFVLPDNDGIDQLLVQLFISWQCSKSQSCLNKSDTTVIRSLMQLLLLLFITFTVMNSIKSRKMPVLWNFLFSWDVSGHALLSFYPGKNEITLPWSWWSIALREHIDLNFFMLPPDATESCFCPCVYPWVFACSDRRRPVW